MTGVQTCALPICFPVTICGDKEIPVAYLLGEQYVKAMQDMAKSNNAKTVVLPADVLNTIRGVMGRNNP